MSECISCGIPDGAGTLLPPDARRAIVEQLREELRRRGVVPLSPGRESRRDGAPASRSGPERPGPAGRRWSPDDWPVGGLSIITGRGRSSLAVLALATPTRGGDMVAWVDLPGSFYPAGAARLGVVLDRLVWVRPDDVDGGLWAARMLLAARSFVRVVVDLPVSRGDPRFARALPRLLRESRRTGGCPIVLSETAFPGATLTLVAASRGGAATVRWRWGAWEGVTSW